MAINGGRIDYTIGFKTDTSGLGEFERSFAKIQSLTSQDLMNLDKNLDLNEANQKLLEIQKSAQTVHQALIKSFDVKLNTVNIQKFNSELTKSGMSTKQFITSLQSLGTTGQQAAFQLTKGLLTTHSTIKKTKTLVDKMGETLVNTLKWNISSSLINRFTGSIQQAWGYVQHLDTSLNDIRIVTGKSADEMDKFAEKANKAAQALGKSTTEYTEAALIYYQQGLSDEETAARTETTLKAASVTGQSAKSVSEQLTAVWNGYRVTAEGTEEAVDKLAAVAATTAADLEELSTGMSKVASAANSMGVDMDQLNATIATIESVTRQAPESVGTALKTIYARMGDLKLGDTDEDGLKLGDVSSTLSKVGIEILDVNGELRDMGVVIEEIGEKWNTWTKAQQTAIAESVAGKRQYNNLFALFDNWDMYTNALETSRNSTGTLQKQQDIYMESTAAHLQQLKTEWEDLYDSILDTDTINSILDGFTKILNEVTKIIDGLGGGKTLLTTILAIVTQITGKHLAREISTAFQNRSQNQLYIQQQQDRFQESKRIGQTGQAGIDAMTQATERYGKAIQYMNEAQVAEMEERTARLGDIANEIDITEKAIDQKQQEKDEIDKNTAERQNEIQTIKDEIAATEELIEKKKQEYQENREKENQQQKEQAAVSLKSITSIMGERGFNNRRTDRLEKFSSEEVVGKWDSKNKNITNIKNDLETLQNQAQLAQKDINQLLNPKNAKDATLEATLQRVKQEAEDLYRAGQISESQKNGILNITTLRNHSNTAQELLRTVREKAKETVNTVQDITSTLDGVKDKKLDVVTDEEKQELESLNNTLTENNNKLKENEASVEQNKEDKQKLTEEEEKLNVKLKENTAALEREKEGFTNALNPAILQARTDAIVNISQASLSLLSAFNMLNGSLEQFAEGNLSAGQALMSLLSIILMARRGLVSVTKATEAYSTALQEQGMSAMEAEARTHKLTMGITAAGLAITAAIVVIRKIIQARKEHIEAIRKENQALIDESRESMQEYNKNRQLIDSYKDLTEQYRQGAIDAEEFAEKKKDLLKVASLELRAALDAAEGWEEASKKASEYIIESNEAEVRKQKRGGQAALDNLKLKLEESSGEEIKTILEEGIGIEGNNTQIQKYYNDLVQKGLGQYSIDNFGQQTFQFVEELTPEIINKLAQIDEQYKRIYGEEFSTISDLLSDIDLDSYNEALESQKALDQLYLDNAKEMSAIDYAKTEKDIENAKKVFTEYLQKNSSFSNDKILDEFNKVLAQSSNKVAQDQAGLNTLAYKMIAKWAEGYNGEISNSKEFKDALRKASMLEQEGLTNISFLTEEDWYELNQLNDEELKTELANRIAKYEADCIKAANEQFRANISETSDSLGDTITKAITGDLTAEDETYQNLADQLEKIKNVYPELTDEIQTFTNAGLIGTEHWINSTYRLQEAIDSIEYEELIKKGTEAREKLNREGITGYDVDQYDDKGFYTDTVHIEADDSKFQEAMDEIMDAEYAIDVEVHSDADRDFNRLVSSLDQADEMASKIGEDFVVAADDIRDLNNAFPGILEGIEYLGDGTIKLNEDIVKSAMNAASAEEAADTQKTITKLQNAATELRAKAKTYDAVADIAAKAAQDENYQNQAKSDIDTKLKELAATNSKIKADVEIDNAIAVTDNSQLNARNMAENWTQAYQEAATASYEFAKDAIANAQQVALGPDGVAQPPSGDYGVNYQGNAGKKASESTDATGQFTNADDTIDWNRMEQSYREMAEAARANANDIEGMMVGAAAKATETMKNNLDAATGRPKEEKGSSDSGKDADHEEYLEREEDIYRTINAELEQIESTLGRIQKINDHEWGIDAQKTLEEENKLLDEQLDKLEEKRALQEADLSIRRKQLEDIGVSFTADGSAMTNAEAKLNQLYAQYNSMVDHYNNLSADAQEVYKAELEAEKEKIDAIEKKMDEYESGFSDYQSTLDKILDTHYEAIANEVNQFNNMVEVHLELNEAEKEWNDFWKEVVEDVEDTDFAGQIAASMRQLKVLVGTRNDNNASTVKMLTNHLNETVGEVQAQIASANRGGEDSIFGDDTALSKEKLTDYRDKLMGAVREAKTEIDNISDNYIKLLESAQTKIDEQIEGWNSIGDQINHDIELIKLVSGDKAFDALNKQYEKQYENDLKLIETQKMSQDYWKEQIAKYQKLVETTDKSSVEWKTYDKSLQDSIKNYRKAVQDLDKTVQESIKDLQTWRENNVKAIEDTLDKAMSGGIGLDLAEEQWKLINDYADQYYDNVERAFNMEDYTNVLNSAANAIGLSAENQEKLNQFREQELAQLNSKNKLTQYDIDESKARLEILKAEMALQDAKNNRSNMRLRRDSQGNYTYQYVGDEAAQEQAENGLLTAKREWYELVKQRNKETNEYIIQLGRDRVKLQQELAQAQLDGDQEKIDKLLDLIKKNEEQQVLAYGWAEEAKQDLMDGTATYFANVEKKDILPMWDTTVNKMVDKWAKGETGFIPASEKAVKSLEKVQQEYGQKTKEILDKAGIEYTELKEQGIDPTEESLEGLVETNEELETELENINDLLSDQEGYLKDAEAAYNDLKDAAVGAIQEANYALQALAQTAIQTVQQVQAAIAAASSAASVTSSMIRNSVSSSGGTGTGASTGTNGSFLGKSFRKTAQIYTNPYGAAGTYAAATSDGQIMKISNTKDDLRKWLEKNGYTNIIEKYATGGYTGSWGKEGKLAVLHQKELVLNQDDTTNILKAVEAIRQVVASSNLGGNLLNASMTSSNMLSRISAGVLQGVSNFDNSSSNTSTSMVINADFSGVRSADEIYQALLELQNYGLQQNYSVAPHINIGY